MPKEQIRYSKSVKGVLPCSPDLISCFLDGQVLDRNRTVLLFLRLALIYMVSPYHGLHPGGQLRIGKGFAR